jgi:hypothetical protein
VPRALNGGRCLCRSLDCAHTQTSMFQFAQGLLEISSILGYFVPERMLMPLELLLHLRNAIPNLWTGRRRASEETSMLQEHGQTAE